jgi:hypothetical protein
MTEALQRM